MNVNHGQAENKRKELVFSKDRWQNLRYGLHWRWSSCDVEFDVKPHRKAERAHLAKDVLCVTKLFSIRACSEGSFDVPAYCRSVVYGILDTVPRISAPPHLNGRVFVQSRWISLDVAIPLSLDSGPGHFVVPFRKRAWPYLLFMRPCPLPLLLAPL